MWDLSVKGKF
jgi:hypothetical protein